MAKGEHKNVKDKNTRRKEEKGKDRQEKNKSGGGEPKMSVDKMRK